MATVLTPAEIKQKITDWITTNGQGDITGAHLNTILAAIMDYVGVGYAFMGEAPASAPSPDVPSAYLAAPGTYTNYESGDTVIPEGSIAILKYDGSAWSKSVIKVCDPVSVSQNTLKIGNNKVAAFPTEFATLPVAPGFIKECFIDGGDGPYYMYRVDKNVANPNYDNNKYLIYITKSSGNYVGVIRSMTPDILMEGVISHDGHSYPIKLIVDWEKYEDGSNTYSYVPLLTNYCYDIKFSPTIQNLIIQSDINGIQSDINGIQSDINGIQSDINGIQSDINDIDDKVDGIDFNSTMEQLTVYGTINGYMLNGKISEYAAQLINIYQVEKGKQYKVTGSYTTSAGEKYDGVVFFENYPAIGSTADEIILGQQEWSGVYEIEYLAPSDGFICCYCRSSGWSQCDEFIYNLKVEDELQQLKEDIGFEDVETELESTDLIENAYLGPGVTILSGNYGNIKVYPVIASQNVLIKQVANYASTGEVNNGYKAAIFTTVLPAIGVEGIAVLNASVDAQQYNWVAPSNGYLCCWERSDNRNCFAYSVTEEWKYKDVLDNLDPEVIATLVEKVYPLKGKTVAILGDSIMQNMCNPNIPTNVTTFKDITDVDPTEYTVDDITIIDGYIYLTSTLVDGQIGPNTIRLRPINSGQAAIDHKRWYDLENKLQTGDMFVLGMGGGRIVESTNKIITAYPARHSSGILDGLMEDLPNQIRQLLRVVSEGIHNAPDCVIIWMGVNGADTVITDTYEDAMAIDWDTLKDDHLGYTYRSKFYGAMRFAIESIYRAFPFATIFIISPAQNSRGDEKIDGSGPAYRGYTSLGNVAEAMRIIANRYACVFVDALHEMGLANFSYRADTTLNGNEISTGTRLGNLVPTFLNSVEVDGLHPNSVGKILWANYLVTQLKAKYYPKQDD